MRVLSGDTLLLHLIVLLCVLASLRERSDFHATTLRRKVDVNEICPQVRSTWPALLRAINSGKIRYQFTRRLDHDTARTAGGPAANLESDDGVSTLGRTKGGGRAR